jgi:hypothetical protein
MSHYRITPLEKKSIEIFYELYRKNPNTGELQCVNINETFRWGQGFVEEDLDCNLPWEGDTMAYCKMDAGEYEGCEFDDSISVNFEFDETISEEEQESIKESYYESGSGWIHDGDHDWEIEDDYIVVYGPYKVELCNEDGTIATKVKLKSRPDPSTAWPFSQDFPKTEE